MKLILVVAALSLMTVGCKKKKAAEATNDCGAAVSHSMALSKTEMEKMGTDAATMQKMVDVGVKRCTEDKWSADAVKCMTDAKAMADSQACYDKLTPDQQEKMNKAAAELAKGPHDGSAGSAGSAMGSDSGSAGSGAPDTGSGSADSGSAGSGSAAGSAAPATP